MAGLWANEVASSGCQGAASGTECRFQLPTYGNGRVMMIYSIEHGFGVGLFRQATRELFVTPKFVVTVCETVRVYLML